MASLYSQQLYKTAPSTHQILFVRNPGSVPSNLLPQQSSTIEYRQLDLSHLAHVKEIAQKLAKDIREGKVPPITALVLSAAIQLVGPDQPYFTPDGYEEAMAVNHLAHYIIIRELTGSLDKTGSRGESKFFRHTLKAMYG
jgi:NAD(P)-dependent dehydrogenase (short-subunit alcohol dehydrogenase family)